MGTDGFPSGTFKIKGGLEMEEDRREYRTLLERRDVAVKVPNRGPYMNSVAPHSFELHGEMVQVKGHFRHGLVLKGIEKNVILNRLFFGVGSQDLGKKIVAKVEVVEKTTQESSKRILLNIFKAPDGTKAAYDMKFSETEGNIMIPGTNTKIQFKKR
jgi:hypothetical protein